jgi:predicted ATPase
VVEVFAESAAAQQELLRMASGQCVEHYGPGEAYLPVLEALEAVTAEVPLVLVLEDLHWSDYATLDLLAALARRREAARLLAIGTYRPMELIVRGHPLKGLKQELQVHGQCAELALGALSEAAVTDYLAAQCPRVAPTVPLERLAQWVSRRTEGNPLFMVHTVAYLRARGALREASEPTGQEASLRVLEDAEHSMPETLQQMIDQQIDRLSPAEQQLLEVASVAGAEFSAAVAAGLGIEPDAVEVQCEALVRRQQFLERRETAEWPDGTMAGRYGFRHVLYRDALSGRLTAKRRVRLHQAIGERLEQAYGARAAEIAAELAVHFEQGRNLGLALRYLQQAAEKDLRRLAPHEAIGLLTRGLALLDALPDTSERTQHELALQITLGSALIAVKGYTAPEVEQAYTRARVLCRMVGETPQLFSALCGLWTFYYLQAELQTAYELAEQLLAIARKANDSTWLVEAHQTLGTTLVGFGRLASAGKHFGQSIAYYEPTQHGFLAFMHGRDPGILCRFNIAMILWFRGFPEQARTHLEAALTWAQALAHPLTQIVTLNAAVWIHHFCVSHEAEPILEYYEALGRLGIEHEIPLAQETHLIMGGWIQVMQGQVDAGIARIRQTLANYQPSAMQVMRAHHFGLLADLCAVGGRIEEGLDAVTKALKEVERVDEHLYEAELYRIQGILTLKSCTAERQASRAEACFLKAIATSRRQGNKLFEFRAVMSLSRLWQRQGKIEEARRMLTEIYHSFTEGFDTPDMQEARALLAELSSKDGQEIERVH